MKLIYLVTFIYIVVANCFRSFPFQKAVSHPIYLRNVDIISKNLDVSETLRTLIESKIDKATKNVESDITSIHVNLKAILPPESEHHTHLKMDAMTAEVTVRLKGGHVIHVRESSDHMYSSVDLVADKLQKAIRRQRTKRRTKDLHAARQAKVESEEDSELGVPPYMAELEEKLEGGSDAVDPPWMEEYLAKEEEDPHLQPLLVEREKEFLMLPITIQEAAAALETIDHPFYMFRNKATNEINIVYRRGSGGVGHIAPKATAEAPTAPEQ